VSRCVPLVPGRPSRPARRLAPERRSSHLNLSTLDQTPSTARVVRGRRAMSGTSSTDERAADSPRVTVRAPRQAPVRLTPVALVEWLQDRKDSLAGRWADGIRDRGTRGDARADGLLERFTTQLAGFLPWLLGPYREMVDPLWVRACELFGSVGARRGLAAGEVIEEFQLLRELVIRDLYRDPPLGGRLPLSLREILRLNRGIDRGVTHASVGHTDALFFQFLEGGSASGAPEGPERGESLVREALQQLDAIEEEMTTIVGHALPPDSEP